MKNVIKYFNLIWCLPSTILIGILTYHYFEWYHALFITLYLLDKHFAILNLKDKTIELQNTVNELLEWKNNQ